jgi:hypothetical protein
MKVPPKKPKIPTAFATLMKAIRTIPGEKIVTLAVQLGEQTFDIQEDGTVGYDPSHEKLMKKMIEDGLSHGGGLLVRQFLPLKIERLMPNGTKQWVPKKNVYGVFLAEGSWAPLSADEVKAACTTNAQSGAPLSQESDIYYRQFPVAVE